MVFTKESSMGQSYKNGFELCPLSREWHLCPAAALGPCAADFMLIWTMNDSWVQTFREPKQFGLGSRMRRVPHPGRVVTFRVNLVIELAGHCLSCLSDWLSIERTHRASLNKMSGFHHSSTACKELVFGSDVPSGHVGKRSDPNHRLGLLLPESSVGKMMSFRNLNFAQDHAKACWHSGFCFLLL